MTPLIPKGRGLTFALAVIGSYALAVAVFYFLAFCLTHMPEAVKL